MLRHFTAASTVSNLHVCWNGEPSRRLPCARTSYRRPADVSTTFTQSGLRATATEWHLHWMETNEL